MVVAAAAAAANGSSEKEKRNCEQANERAGSGGGDMSALQIAATQQRVCRGQVSLPETQLGTVSVSADGNSVFFLGEFLVSQIGDHPYQVAVVCFLGIFICSQIGDHPYQLAVFFLRGILYL
jgi:hypothetical protein